MLCPLHLESQARRRLPTTAAPPAKVTAHGLEGDKGCVTAEGVPRASSTRATMLGPGSLCPTTRGILHPPGNAPKEEDHVPPHHTANCPLRAPLPCVLTSLPSMHSPPARAHLQVLVWLPVLSGEAGGRQQAGASSWLCETAQFQCWKDGLQGEDKVQSVLRVSSAKGQHSPVVGVPRQCQKP